jgi:hypothetical protein
MVRRILLLLAVTGLNGCVLFSVPKHSSVFDPDAAFDRDCSVSTAPPLNVSWTREQDPDFHSYTVVRGLNPTELRDYLTDPGSAVPSGITVITVIPVRTTTNYSPAGYDPVYANYFGVIYETSAGRKGSDVATYRP